MKTKTYVLLLSLTFILSACINKIDLHGGIDEEPLYLYPFETMDNKYSIEIILTLNNKNRIALAILFLFLLFFSLI